MVLLLANDVDIADARVGRAISVPDNHLPSKFLLHIVTEMGVGHEDDLLVGRNRADDFHRIGRRTAQIALGLDRRRAVDITDHDRTGMFCFLRLKLFGGNHIGHGASGEAIGKQNGFFRTENSGGFGHEVNSAEHNHLFLELGGLAAQLQRVPGKISDRLDFVRLIVVGDNDRAAFPFKFLDSFFYTRHGFPSKRRVYKTTS